MKTDEVKGTYRILSSIIVLFIVLTTIRLLKMNKSCGGKGKKKKNVKNYFHINFFLKSGVNIRCFGGWHWVVLTGVLPSLFTCKIIVRFAGMPWSNFY